MTDIIFALSNSSRLLRSKSGTGAAGLAMAMVMRGAGEAPKGKEGPGAPCGGRGPMGAPMGGRTIAPGGPMGAPGGTPSPLISLPMAKEDCLTAEVVVLALRGSHGESLGMRLQ